MSNKDDTTADVTNENKAFVYLYPSTRFHRFKIGSTGDLRRRAKEIATCGPYHYDQAVLIRGGETDIRALDSMLKSLFWPFRKPLPEKGEGYTEFFCSKCFKDILPAVRKIEDIMSVTFQVEYGVPLSKADLNRKKKASEWDRLSGEERKQKTEEKRKKESRSRTAKNNRIAEELCSAINRIEPDIVSYYPTPNEDEGQYILGIRGAGFRLFNEKAGIRNSRLPHILEMEGETIKGLDGITVSGNRSCLLLTVKPLSMTIYGGQHYGFWGVFVESFIEGRTFHEAKAACNRLLDLHVRLKELYTPDLNVRQLMNVLFEQGRNCIIP